MLPSKIKDMLGLKHKIAESIFTEVATNANAYWFEGDVLNVDFSMLKGCSKYDIEKDIGYLIARHIVEKAEKLIRDKAKQAIYMCYNTEKTAAINFCVVELDKQKTIDDGHAKTSVIYTKK